MKTHINEDLKGALVEPKSKSTNQAKKNGLSYTGFGRYSDNTGQTTHVVQNDKLIPFSQALKSKSFNDLSTDDYGDYINNMQPELDDIHNTLVDAYSPDKYQSVELDAIQQYTSGLYSDVNAKLSTLPIGIGSNQIQPETSDDLRPNIIAALDSAIMKVKSPIDFIVYITLDGTYFDPFSIQKGSKYIFRGYRSTTINPSIALESADTALLQIHVKRNNYGMYIDDFSAMPGEGEFILPRGTIITIVSDPTPITGSMGSTGEPNKQIIIYDCEISTPKL